MVPEHQFQGQPQNKTSGHIRKASKEYKTKPSQVESKSIFKIKQLEKGLLILDHKQA